MSVTVNPKARQILPVILGCCVIGTVFFLAITICSAIKYHDYVPVDAVISSVSRSNNPNKPHTPTRNKTTQLTESSFYASAKPPESMFRLNVIRRIQTRSRISIL